MGNKEQQDYLLKDIGQAKYKNLKDSVSGKRRGNGRQKKKAVAIGRRLDKKRGLFVGKKMRRGTKRGTASSKGKRP